jgi:hypothetical protein
LCGGWLQRHTGAEAEDTTGQDARDLAEALVVGQHPNFAGFPVHE